MRTDYQYVTVVYKVLNHAAWQPRWDDIHELFKLEDGPVMVTAVSLDDEITRKELMVEAAGALPGELADTIDDIDTAPDVHSIVLDSTPDET